MKKNIVFLFLLFSYIISYSQEKSIEFKSLKEFALHCKANKLYPKINDIELRLLYYHKFYNPNFDKSNVCGKIVEFYTQRRFNIKYMNIYYQLMIIKLNCSKEILTYQIDFEDIDFKSYREEVYQNYLKDKPIDYHSLLMIGKFKIQNMYDSLYYYTKSQDKILQKGAYLGLVRATKIPFKDFPKEIKLSEQDSIFGRSQAYLDEWQDLIVKDTVSVKFYEDYLDYPPRYSMLKKMRNVFYDIPTDIDGAGIEQYFEKLRKYHIVFKKDN